MVIVIAMDLFLGRSHQDLLDWANDAPQHAPEPEQQRADSVVQVSQHLQASGMQADHGWSWQDAQAWDTQADASSSLQDWQASGTQADAGWSSQDWQAAGTQADAGWSWDWQAADSQAVDAQAVAAESQAGSADQLKKVKRPGKNKERGGKHKHWYNAYWKAISEGKSAKEATELANWAEL